MMSLDTPIESLPNTSIVTIKKFKSLGIDTFEDLINYFPFRYDDRSIAAPIFSLQEGDVVTVIGIVKTVTSEYTRRGLRIQKAQLQDSTGTTDLTWFNQPYIVKTLHPGETIGVWGEVKKYGSTRTLHPQEFEKINGINQSIHLNRIVPIYTEKRGLSSKTIREKIMYVLNHAEPDEFLPDSIIKSNQLTNIKDAYHNIHFPNSFEMQKKAKRRLGFNELFTLQLANTLVKKEWEKEKVRTPFKISKFKIQITKFIDSLPFNLTHSQRKALEEIMQDLSKEKPMNRFLQGDVGSGKTVVAAIASYAAHLNGYQSVIMAPTEILAQQHFKTLSLLFNKTKIPIALQAQSHKDVTSKTNTNFAIIVGTHAILNAHLDLNRVGLIVIDEQHRFGVKQRALLKEKGLNPHLLTMTATPIPRTAALTIFGELDMSVIDELPSNRLPIKSWVVQSEKRLPGYKWIQKQIDQGDQAYIICPLIEESSIESMQSIRAATKEFEFLQKNMFPTLRLALLHRKMKAVEKEKVMQQFNNHELDILVSTSVVEVGIDVPNATIIVIEGAERFGLAQLHQLRGRVGRGPKQSYCLLFTSKGDQIRSERLNFFASHLKGIDIAEYDLQNRGAGQLYGTKQHGYDDLKIASLADYKLIEQTQQAVHFFLKNFALKNFSKLKELIQKYEIQAIAKD